MEGLAILLLVDSVPLEKGSLRGESNLVCWVDVDTFQGTATEAKSRGADTGSARFGNYAPYISSPHSSHFYLVSCRRIAFLVWPEKTSGDAHTAHTRGYTRGEGGSKAKRVRRGACREPTRAARE